MTSFQDCVEFILEHEGGYVFDPRDPGGETNYGISKRQYPEKDIKSLTKTDAVLIYRTDYWEAVSADELPGKIRLAVFDCAVNQGVGTAIHILQRVLRVKMDGVIGPVTLGVSHSTDPRRLAINYMTERGLRYSRTRNFDVYGRGWFNRLFSVSMS